MEARARPVADIVLSMVLIAVGLVVIYGTLDLPPGTFEPLGSATIPQAVACGMIGFAAWTIVHALAERRALARRQAGAGDESDEPAARPRHDLALGLMALTVVYVLVMAMGWLRFSLATLAFLVISIGMLSGFERRVLPALAVLALGLAFGLEYLFTRVFVIDLP
ncbi:MAG: tripartite tricarboxylate transporter TctB family protein [Ectothiorhodospiraceae bacterium]|nr:tripartite tricarboxylate transporter TctB family protein [Ectothiorhodospiraceae bacterium]